MVASEGREPPLEERSERGDPSEDREIKRLTAAIEETAKHLNGLSVTYLALVVYVLVTLGSIDDVALLVGRVVTLPLLNVDVPLRQFLWVAPCFVFALHSHMLMQLGRLRARVCSLTEAWKGEQVKGGESKSRVRNEWFFPFPPIEIFLATKPVWKPSLFEAQERYLPRVVILVLYVFVYTILPIGTLVFALHKTVLYHVERLIYLDFMVLALGLAVVSFKFPIRPCASLPKEEWWLQKALFFVFVCGYLVLLPIYCQLEEGATCSEGVFHRHLDVTGEDLVGGGTEGPTKRLQLRGRNLHCAVLRGVDLREADLRGADLSQADLREADLRGVVLVPADMSYRRWGDLATFAREAELLDRRRDTREGISRLDGADLSKANLAGSQLAFASMRGAILTDTVLGLADLTGVDARGTDFRHSHLEGVSLLGAQLDGANFTRASLTGASLRLAELVGATLLGTRLEFADLSGSLLTGASLVDAEAQGASFDGMEGRLVDIRGGRLDGSQGLRLVESVLSHAEVFRAGLDLRLSDIREVNRSPRLLDLGGLVTDRLDAIRGDYEDLPRWEQWESEMKYGRDDSPSPEPSGPAGTHRPDVCNRGLVWQDLGGGAQSESDQPCRSSGKKDFYSTLAKEMLNVIGKKDGNPFLRKALLDRVCGVAVPRLRDLEDAFRDRSLASRLRTILEKLSEDALEVRCPLLDEPENGARW